MSAPGDMLETFSFSADGTLLAAAFWEAGASGGPQPAYVQVWRVETGAELLAVEVSVPADGYPLLASSADGGSVAFVTGQTLSLRDVTTDRETASLALPRRATHLALSPDGTRLAVGSFGNEEVASVSIRDAASGTELHHIEGASGTEWSRDGRFLLTSILEGPQEGVDADEMGFSAPTLLRADDFSRVDSFVNGHLHRVVLEATPEYLDEQRYRVTGSMRLDGGTAIPFEGTVTGNESQRYLAPQARRPEAAEFNLALQDHPWKLHGRQDWEQGQEGWRQARRWSGSIEDASFSTAPLSTLYLEPKVP